MAYESTAPPLSYLANGSNITIRHLFCQRNRFFRSERHAFPEYGESIKKWNFEEKNMRNTTENQWSILISVQESDLKTWINNFLIDRKAQNMAKGTLYFYKTKLELFTKFCDSQSIDSIFQIDSNLIRQFLFYLETTDHNAGGIHACYRALKTFLNWWDYEVEPENWKNPIRKVKSPMNPVEIKDPANIDDVQAIIDTCSTNSLIGLRDKAIFFILLDTGVRAQELLSLTHEYINLATGEMIIRLGKGRKQRVVYIGAKTKKLVKAYLRFRTDNSPYLWITKDSEPLTYWGLKSMVKRRAKIANVHPPEIHAFRRWFALTCLRAGADVYAVQELMGHADLQIMKRYLKQTNQDIMLAHKKASPVDSL
ncbi:MAG: hypothetical protein C0410_10510 [Anaerolinea sp.]|nr:hypothetical protein [Anaerolinea sp.]